MDARELIEELRGRADRYHAEFRSQPRLRRMALCVGALLVLYLNFGLKDYRNTAFDEQIRLVGELTRLSEAGSTELWSERYTTEVKANEALIANCWNAESARLASADLQTLLRDVLSENQVDTPRLSLGQPEALTYLDREYFEIRAQVRGRFELRMLPELLTSFSAPQKQVAVEQLSYVARRGAGTLNMTLVACFLSEVV
ncbi:MAG: hypothetical protein JJ956_09405 [Pseudomonadales bacterium]|nr:hypothetical protein [Pseudomonadales bacterium]